MSIFTLKPIIDLLYSEVSNYVQEINELKDRIAMLEADNMMLRDVLATPMKVERVDEPIMIDNDVIQMMDTEVDATVKKIVVEDNKTVQKKGKPRVAAKVTPKATPKSIVIDDTKYAKAAETFETPSNQVVESSEDKEKLKKDYQKEYQRNYRKMKKEKSLKA